jgi:hypothetical protein
MKREPRRRKLTDLAVARLREPGITWDTLLPAFGIRVGATRKTWIVAVRRPGGANPVRLKIGTVPSMGIADARTRARQMMEGGAPEAPIAFGVMAEAFLEHGRTKAGRPLRQTTADQYRRNLARYAAPLYSRPVAEISRREVAGLLAGVAKNSGAPTVSLIRAMLTRLSGWAIEVGFIDRSPATGLPVYAVSKRSRVLSDAELHSGPRPRSTRTTT